MSIDLTKLTPAPWVSVRRSEECSDFENRQFVIVEEGQQWIVAWGHRSETDADFIALARNAFGVMMRRGWAPHKGDDGQWRACLNCNGDYGPPEPATGSCGWPDPFTALVEADAWYKEHEPAAAAAPQVDESERKEWLTDPEGPSEHPDDLR